MKEIYAKEKKIMIIRHTSFCPLQYLRMDTIILEKESYCFKQFLKWIVLIILLKTFLARIEQILVHTR